MTYAFVYGTLKKGFSNYWLMEDVCSKGHARFLGFARTKEMFPMVCGPYQVPFLIDIPSSGHHVRGELYEVDRIAIERLDELEGVSKGNYVRRPIVLSALQLQSSVEQESLSSEIIAQAYFAAPSYASKIAKAPHIEAFTEKEYATYVRRKDRPQNRTFLQHIEHWIKTQELARKN
jgi:gamma-glutamylaminecyclotransferase